MLTPQQLTALKADILADAVLAALPNTPDGNTAIAAAYALAAAPDFWVWRSFVSDTEIYEATTEGLTWSWSIFIGRSQGERDAWHCMVGTKGGINPSLVNVRAAVTDIFSGAGGVAQRTYLTTIGRRLATRIEKLLASGTGSTAAPAVLGFEGMLSADDVQQARLA